MNKATLVFTLGMSLLGCGSEELEGRSDARLSEVETTRFLGGVSTVERTELRYDGDQLSQVNAFRNGAPNGSARLSWAGDNLQRVDSADKDGDRSFTTFEYLDNKYLWKTHYEVTGAITLDRTVWYDEATAIVKELAYSRSSPGTTTHNWRTRYEYDPQGRVKKMIAVDGDATQTSELSYTTEGLVDRMSMFTGPQHDETYNMRYTQDGLLDEITDTHNRSVSVSYGADGLIDEVRVLDGSSSETYRYRYEEGTVSGMTFAPDIPVASQFDLRGKSYGDLALLHGAPPIEVDVPHVSNDTVCVSNDGTSCSACLENYCCDTCTTSTCYDYAQCAASCDGSSSCLSSCASYYPGNASFGSCASSYCSASCSL